jgi:predicted dithiol-disulfide oxidoreductase (DUF899 family)
MGTMLRPVVGTREEWRSGRLALLAKEKRLSRLRDELSRERRELPWVCVDEEYVFDTPDGPRSLSELFGSKSQLLVYHFMFGPDWTEGCPSCSFWIDGFDGMAVHLAHRDVELVAVSRAPRERLEAYKARMGWRIPWVSSSETASTSTSASRSARRRAGRARSTTTGRSPAPTRRCRG